MDLYDAKDILRLYLEVHGKRSSLEAVKAMGRVRSLLAREVALEKMVEQRSTDIYAALRAAGIPENQQYGDGILFRREWPDNGAVNNYIWVSCRGSRIDSSFKILVG